MDELKHELLKDVLDQDSIFYAIKTGEKFNKSKQQMLEVISYLYNRKLFSCYIYDDNLNIVDVIIEDFGSMSDDEIQNTWMAPTEHTFVELKKSSGSA